jgi:hypothetical protein
VCASHWRSGQGRSVAAFDDHIMYEIHQILALLLFEKAGVDWCHIFYHP